MTLNTANMITIDKYNYTLKAQLINDYFTYRYKKRKKCGLV